MEHFTVSLFKKNKTLNYFMVSLKSDVNSLEHLNGSISDIGKKKSSGGTKIKWMT